jgi:hypothetical protein
MEPIMTTLSLEALKQTVTFVTKKILNKVWEHDINKGKELIRQLSEDYSAEVYVEKYVNRFMKMRTLHSAESDVYLDAIYSPLKLEAQSNGTVFTVDDGFTLDNRQVINIIGIAGQGKSTILRKLFLEELLKAKRFPFMIELRRVENATIINHLKQQLKDIGLKFGDDDVEILLQSKKVVLMLDGYDEIPSNNRHRLLNEIMQLNTRYCCDIIVTTRPGTEICSEVNIINLKVKNLETDEIISIISKLDNKGEQEDLPKLIKENQQLRDTLVSPILVNLLYVCYPYLDVVPESVVDFYDKLFITLFSRHDKIKNFNREKYSPITAIDAIKIFNAFCFDSINKNYLEFTEESLYIFLNSAIKLNQISPSFTEQIQKDLINITCLIQMDGFDKYVFLHKSVQEFHAAKFISSLPHKHKKRCYSNLLKNIDLDDKFDNVLLFLKHIDTDDYNNLLISEYFIKNNLTRINTKKLKPLTDKIIKDKGLEFQIDGNLVSHKSMQSLTHKSLISTLLFFRHGSRGADSLADEMLADIFFNSNTIELNKLREISSNRIKPITLMSHSNEKQDEIIRTTVYDYLKSVDAMDVFLDVLNDEIKRFYNEIYVPIYEKNQQVSRILDMDFVI